MAYVGSLSQLTYFSSFSAKKEFSRGSNPSQSTANGNVNTVSCFSGRFGGLAIDKTPASRTMCEIFRNCIRQPELLIISPVFRSFRPPHLEKEEEAEAVSKTLLAEAVGKQSNGYSIAKKEKILDIITMTPKRRRFFLRRNPLNKKVLKFAVDAVPYEKKRPNSTVFRRIPIICALFRLRREKMGQKKLRERSPHGSFYLELRLGLPL